MKKQKRIIFRADGNARIGLGHLVRSLALATMLQDEFRCAFVSQDPPPDFLRTLQSAGIDAIILPNTADYDQEATDLVTRLSSTDVVVLDSYSFGTAYQKKLKSKGNKIICLDDIHAFPFKADGILNQAGGITPAQYQAEPYTQFYLGPAYALLREPFLKAATQTRKITEVKSILLNMGGADPENQTLHLLQTVLKNQKALHIQVVVGAAYRYFSELKTYAHDNPNITIHQNLDAQAMCNLMQACEAAILPPSSVSYEWCSVSGLLFVHQIADNQKDLAAFLMQNGLAYQLNEFERILNHPERTALLTQQVQEQRKYFDGKSKTRLKRIFSDLALLEALHLRPAAPNDMEQLFEWVNDPEVRKHSFNPAPIPLEMHQRWFSSKINNPDCLILLAVVDSSPAGMIRFDIHEDQATISYLLDKNFRGQGLGSLVLTAGTVQLQQHRPDIRRLIGHVQLTNLASIISFRKAGFTEIKDVPLAEPNSLIFAKKLI